ncbi:hypothetical protein [Nonomuraea insulae]|uniref:Uncharacterized protein n=1 Tax=Nonomuraea insulae TaxID=1616787 RepID=A0ABW1CRR3_9ACTN
MDLSGLSGAAPPGQAEAVPTREAAFPPADHRRRRPALGHRHGCDDALVEVRHPARVRGCSLDGSLPGSGGVHCSFTSNADRGRPHPWYRMNGREIGRVFGGRPETRDQITLGVFANNPYGGDEAMKAGFDAFGVG